MSLPYKKVLVIGATSGIGKALATKLVENGTQLIIAGRREKKLNAFVQEHGLDKVTAKVFDIMQLDQVRISDITRSGVRTNGSRFPSSLPKSLPTTPTWTVSSSTPAFNGLLTFPSRRPSI